MPQYLNAVALARIAAAAADQCSPGFHNRVRVDSKHCSVVVSLRPDGTAARVAGHYVYNDRVGSTTLDRHLDYHPITRDDVSTYCYRQPR